MIAENSGQFYRFTLDHNLGFGFGEVYDFTDLTMFDGRLVYVYNRHDTVDKVNYELCEIRGTGLALGPIRLHKFPNTRGLHSWKYLFKSEDFVVTELPPYKELHALQRNDSNWDNYKGKWYQSSYDQRKELPIYVDYQKVRELETRIINPPAGVVTKFTMKLILDRGDNLSAYYDLSDPGKKAMFIQLVNTYYPLKDTRKFLKQLPGEPT